MKQMRPRRYLSVDEQCATIIASMSKAAAFRTQWWKLIAVLTFVASLAINGLANTKILGGNTTAEVSDSYPNLFAPDGMTFSIWGLIYLLLIGFCVRLFWRRQNQGSLSDTTLKPIAQYFTGLSLLNGIWLIAWQYRLLWLSVVLMGGLLYMLIRTMQCLHTYKTDLVDYISVVAPFSIYFGWITVATIANITTWLVSIGWSGGGLSDLTWLLIVLIVGAGIGLATTWRFRSPIYLGVFVWAYFGIWLKHTSAGGFDGRYPVAILLLQFLLVLFGFAFGILLLQRFREKRS